MLKRGEYNLARKSIYWPIASFLLVIVAMVFIFFLVQLKGTQAEINPQLQAEFISLRFVNTPECFAYDATSPGIIDPRKFTQERMEQCYSTTPDKGFKEMNFALALEGYTPTDNGKLKPLRTNNYFEQIDFTLNKPVIVRNGDEFEKRTLTIYVQEKI